MFNLSIANGVAISEIFDLEISQKEGELAIAQVQVRNNVDYSSISGKLATIRYNDFPLFRGMIQEYPNYVDATFMNIRMIATYDQKQLVQLVDQVKKLNLQNSTVEHNIENITQITEVIPCRVYFSRTSNEIKLSEICPQSYKYDLRPKDYWNFSIYKKREAYSKIDVSVSAQWIHAFSGITDLCPMIADLFPGKRINSINNISAHWWKLVRNLPHSCYTIANSKLSEIFPPNSSFSEEFIVDGKPVRIKRFWFQGMLDLCWDYRQKMQETVTFSLVYDSPGETKKLNFDLGTISCDEVSFFKTKNGIECLQSMAKRAFNHILASQRNIEMTLLGDFEALYKITVDDSVRVTNSHISTIGKVIQTTIKVTDSKKYVKLKVAASAQHITLPETSEFFKRHLNNWSCEKELSDKDIVKGITVENLPDYQIESAKQRKFKNVTELKTFLSKIPTKIRIKLKSLNTCRCLKRQFRIAENIQLLDIVKCAFVFFIT